MVCLFFFIEKDLLCKFYTLAEILSKMFGKNLKEIGDLIYENDLTC